MTMLRTATESRRWEQRLSRRVSVDRCYARWDRWEASGGSPGTGCRSEGAWTWLGRRNLAVSAAEPMRWASDPSRPRGAHGCPLPRGTTLWSCVHCSQRSAHISVCCLVCNSVRSLICQVCQRILGSWKRRIPRRHAALVWSCCLMNSCQ